MSFKLVDSELEQFNKFRIKHNKKHGSYIGAIGGRFSITFTPTGLGLCISVTCNSCDKTKDITDYDLF